MSSAQRAQSGAKVHVPALSVCVAGSTLYSNDDDNTNYVD